MSGHPIPGSRYAGDAGDPDPAVAAALAAHVAGRANGAEVLVALAASRLLVPVVAVAAAGSARDGGASHSGGARSGAIGIEKRTEMALVTITGRDGRRALPVFTSTAALAAWRPDARPVPVPAARAAQAALAEGAAALLVDPAGPVRHIVEDAALEALATGRAGVSAHRDPELLAAVHAAVSEEPAVASAAVQPAANGEALRLTLVLAAETEKSAVTDVAQRLGRRLAAEPVVRARLRGPLKIAIAPPDTEAR